MLKLIKFACVKTHNRSEPLGSTLPLNKARADKTDHAMPNAASHTKRPLTSNPGGGYAAPPQQPGSPARQQPQNWQVPPPPYAPGPPQQSAHWQQQEHRPPPSGPTTPATPQGFRAPQNFAAPPPAVPYGYGQPQYGPSGSAAYGGAGGTQQPPQPQQQQYQQQPQGYGYGSQGRSSQPEGQGQGVPMSQAQQQQQQQPTVHIVDDIGKGHEVTFVVSHALLVTQWVCRVVVNKHMSGRVRQDVLSRSLYFQYVARTSTQATHQEALWTASTARGQPQTVQLVQLHAGSETPAIVLLKTDGQSLLVPQALRGDDSELGLRTAYHPPFNDLVKRLDFGTSRRRWVPEERQWRVRASCYHQVGRGRAVCGTRHRR